MSPAVELYALARIRLWKVRDLFSIEYYGTSSNRARFLGRDLEYTEAHERFPRVLRECYAGK